MKPKLMIQGTMSNAGKSLLTAGILRVLRQDGYLAAPFKSQNMALNSYITVEGLEMGRAQAMQAEAAGIVPSVCMNPILLKPNSQMGSQVILNGEVLGNMKAAEYFCRKREYIPAVLEAYHKLEKQYEVVVIEGAGSPAEINLKQNDIVNMGLAELVDAPVLLVGDIDRGGIFAQLYGTVALLEPSEQARIKGFVMNKFRGDKSLLEPGIQMLYEKCPIPVVGVVPYAELDIEDEDSLSERLWDHRQTKLVDIAVIRLPHISNFTDFNPLEKIEQVSVRYVSARQELQQPDLILLPGTKNTMNDLAWMRENGIEERIRELVEKKESLLLGICGGYQMLGRELADPDNMEQGGCMRGMELLPLRTVFGKSKTRTRVRGKVKNLKGSYQKLTNSTIIGYEIHMGMTENLQNRQKIANAEENGLQQLLDIEYEDGSGSAADGYASGSCMGTYVHGIFESSSFRNSLLELLFERKGLAFQGKAGMDYQTYKEKQFDLLADIVRENMDMKAIYQMMGLS